MLQASKEGRERPLCHFEPKREIPALWANVEPNTYPNPTFVLAVNQDCGIRHRRGGYPLGAFAPLTPGGRYSLSWTPYSQ